MQAVEFEQNNRAGVGMSGVAGHGALWREHDLPDGEARVAVGDCGAVGANFDGSGEAVHIDSCGVAFDLRFNGEMREQLDGRDPGFERTTLPADKEAALTGHGKGLCRVGGSAQDGA